MERQKRGGGLNLAHLEAKRSNLQRLTRFRPKATKATNKHRIQKSKVVAMQMQTKPSFNKKAPTPRGF